jgi:hypothetical protein
MPVERIIPLSPVPPPPVPLTLMAMEAYEHLYRYRPKELAALTARGPEFLQAILEERADTAMNAVEDWIWAYKTRHPPPEGFMERVGFLTMVRKMAEEAILPDLILLPAEDEPTGPEIDVAPLPPYG